MSYRNDQWFKFRGKNTITGENFTSSAKRTGAGYAVPDADNQDFIYPSRAIRTINKDGNLKTEYLKRGYVRSLLTGDGIDIKRCQFQFNPSAINQSVTQNTSILNFLQINPYQYSQPIPGNVTFQFDLFFDRTMEVNNGSRNTTSLTDDPWNNLGPEDIGVLHDLGSLYSIIGVGVNEYMENGMASSAEEFLTQSVDAAVDRLTQQITAEDAVDSASNQRADYKEAVNQLFNVNKGNTAFLLPLPVRIVFSSLYIVEGLVQDFNVLFTKFNTNMVPMQCSVTVTFEAKYIGFAKKDTFFTNALEDLKTNPNLGKSAYSVVSQDLVDEYNGVVGDMSEVTMVVTSGDGNTEFDGRNDDFVVGIGGTNSLKLEQLVSFYKNGQTRKNENLDRFVKVLFTRDSGYLYNLLSTGRSASVNVAGSVTLYRFTQEFIDANDSAKNALNKIEAAGGLGIDPTIRAVRGRDDKVDAAGTLVQEMVNWEVRVVEKPDKDGDDRLYPDVLRVWSATLDSSNVYSDEDKPGLVTASTADEWEDMRDWACLSSNQKGGPKDRNLADGSSAVQEYVMDYDNAYFLAVFTVSIGVTIEGTQLQPQTVTDYILEKSNNVEDLLLRKVLKMNWPEQS